MRHYRPTRHPSWREVRWIAESLRSLLQAPASVLRRLRPAQASRVESDRHEPGHLPNLLPSAGHRLLHLRTARSRPPHHQPRSAPLLRLPSHPADRRRAHRPGRHDPTRAETRPRCPDRATPTPLAAEQLARLAEPAPAHRHRSRPARPVTRCSRCPPASVLGDLPARDARRLRRVAAPGRERRPATPPRRRSRRRHHRSRAARRAVPLCPLARRRPRQDQPPRPPHRSCRRTLPQRHSHRPRLSRRPDRGRSHPRRLPASLRGRLAQHEPQHPPGVRPLAHTRRLPTPSHVARTRRGERPRPSG